MLAKIEILFQFQNKEQINGKWDFKCDYTKKGTCGVPFVCNRFNKHQWVTTTRWLLTVPLFWRMLKK